MSWIVEFLPEANEELLKLDGSVKANVRKSIQKVAQNPLPIPDGYGKPLGNKNDIDLSGLCKIKLLGIGLRVVYKLVKEDNVMKVIIISARADNEVYVEASKRRNKYNL